MVREELLIQRAVEPFHMRVHLRRTGIRMEVREPAFLRRQREMKRELAPIVRLNGIGTIRKNFAGSAQEVSRGE